MKAWLEKIANSDLKQGKWQPRDKESPLEKSLNEDPLIYQEVLTRLGQASESYNYYAPADKAIHVLHGSSPSSGALENIALLLGNYQLALVIQGEYLESKLMRTRLYRLDVLHTHRMRLVRDSLGELAWTDSAGRWYSIDQLVRKIMEAIAAYKNSR